MVSVLIRKYICLAVLAFMALSSVKSEKAGLKISVDHEFISRTEQQFLPKILEKYKKLDLPDQDFSIDLKVGTLYLNLTNINFKFDNFLSENIVTSIVEPSSVTLNIKNLNATGHFDCTSTFWKIIGEKDKIDLKVKNFNLFVLLELTTQESSINKGKMLPSGKLSDLKIDLDLDFDITGPIFAKILSLFKKRIQSTIVNKLKTDLKDTIMQESLAFISSFMANQTVYYNVYKNYDVDYSLTSTPNVKGGSINLFSNGAIIDSRTNFTVPYPVDEIPDSVLKGKGIRLAGSPYLFNSLLYTLFQSGKMQMEISTDDMPKDSKIQFDTTLLDVIIENLSNAYGKDKKVINKCKATKAPVLSFHKDLIDGKLNIECELHVEKESKYERAILFTATLGFNAGATLQEGGVLHPHISDISVLESKVLDTTVADFDIAYIQQLIEFVLKVGAPIINQKFKDFTIPIPSLEFVDLKDSLATVEEGFLNIQVNPQFNLEKCLELIFSAIDGILGLNQVNKTHTAETNFTTLHFLS